LRWRGGAAMAEPEIARFASYVAALGRGPGRSRALTRAEAADAMRLLLAGAVDPIQTGAFLMLLRYRGEDPAEIAGLVDGAAGTVRLPDAEADLDWPSYGAGRTRGAPWFLLAALALAASGTRVLMHGTNAFSGGMEVEQALTAIGMAPCADRHEAAGRLRALNFAYVPARVLSPQLAELLATRRLLGLRSPVNTVARLLNPAGAPAGVDGVFHPPYIETHLAAAEFLGRRRLLVLKGGGGEAERNPMRAVPAYIWDAGTGRSEVLLPPLTQAEAAGEEPDIAAIWRGDAGSEGVEARIVATIALGLLAMGAGGDAEAGEIWRGRGR
jgi:anthranilate phosphoribosyltransferase